jgi:hypothetical protein
MTPRRPVIAYTRPEDYQAALLRMIDAASAVNAEVLDALHHRQTVIPALCNETQDSPICNPVCCCERSHNVAP